MSIKNENAILDQEMDLDELEQSLEAQLEEKFDDLAFLQEEREHINSPDHLGETVMNVVWEQFMNQVAVTAGEDFIKENGGLTLDLRSEAHIQTTENFAKGNIATHNTKIDYQERYNEWQSNFVKDENGNVVTHTTRSGKEEATLTKDARKPFDEGRPTGSVENHTDMDHTVSAAEMIRDPGINAHMTKEEQIAFANSDANLNEMDSSLNRSKGDKSMSEWLDNPNSNGQKPDEIFDISPEEKQKLREKDAEARADLDEKKRKAEQRSIEAGKQSQKEEFFRIGKQALRTAFMSMLAALVKEIIGKLILWLKSAEKTLSTLLEYVKAAIHSFVGKLKGLLTNAADSVMTTILRSLISPVVDTIKKVFTLLKQGWQSLKEAIAYLRAPENRGKPLRQLLPQVGIIVVTGLSGIGAIMLGEVIEKGLTALLPGLGVNIPVLGSPANLIGMLLGAIVCGIIGAIAINLINKYVAKQQHQDNRADQIAKKNEIIHLQNGLTEAKIEKVVDIKENAAQTMLETRKKAQEELGEAMTTIYQEDGEEDYAERFGAMKNDMANLLR